ncbi:MAG TPA: ABC transporter permease [Clostridiales bacterium]|jgi:NitT/TauT family transport system permease protein|nr:ABC transporter permease [Clostridiales bacterium]
MSKRKIALNEYSQEHLLYLESIKRKKLLISILRYALFIIFIALWEVLARFNIIDPFIFSSPSRVIQTTINLYNGGELFMHIGVTLAETVLGFLLGTLAGTSIAIILWWSETIQRVLDPYLVVLNALPKIALGPIIIVWIGAGMNSIIVMALLISLIVTIMTVLSGFMEENAQKQMLMKTLGASKWQIFSLVVLPASVPTIVSALKISVGMSWVGVIVGEYLVSKAGLGYLIVYGGQVFKLDLVMTSIAIISVLAALMYFGVSWLEKALINWRSHSKG